MSERPSKAGESVDDDFFDEGEHEDLATDGHDGHGQNAEQHKIAND